tara:strand:- start:9388 stop:9906 length:519 start_codon:yes stop_codon:yes gene_type:complete
MKTRKIIAVLIFVIIGITTASAQHHSKHDQKSKPERFYKPGSEKFKTMKIAYITEKLDLSSSEAEKFWPIYNEYQTKKGVVFKELKTLKRATKDEKEVTDSEIETILNKRIEAQQKEVDLEKEYLIKFKSVITARKVNELYKAEESFKRELLRKMRDTPPPPAPEPPKPSAN